MCTGVRCPALTTPSSRSPVLGRLRMSLGWLFLYHLPVLDQDLAYGLEQLAPQLEQPPRAFGPSAHHPSVPAYPSIPSGPRYSCHPQASSGRGTLPTAHPEPTCWSIMPCPIVRGWPVNGLAPPGPHSPPISPLLAKVAVPAVADGHPLGVPPGPDGGCHREVLRGSTYSRSSSRTVTYRSVPSGLRASISAAARRTSADGPGGGDNDRQLSSTAGWTTYAACPSGLRTKLSAPPAPRWRPAARL